MTASTSSGFLSAFASPIFREEVESSHLPPARAPLAACSGGGQHGGDAGLSDAGATDGGAQDAGAADGGGADGGPIDLDGRSEAEFIQATIDQAMTWIGVNYTRGEADPTLGLDGAGTVWASLQAIGYAIEPTTSDGLANNYYEANGSQWLFYYTTDAGVTEQALKGQDFSGLRPGDLIILDYDFDWIYDHAAIYLGPYQGMTHAALTASDFHDTCLVEDLDDDRAELTQDVIWSQSIAWWVAVLLQAVLVASGFVAMQSGEADEDRVEQVVGEARIEAHEEAAELFVWSSVALLLLMAGAAFTPGERIALLLAALSTAGAFVVFGLGYRTGAAGGRLVYVHGAASVFVTSGTSPAPVRSLEEEHDDD